MTWRGVCCLTCAAHSPERSLARRQAGVWHVNKADLTSGHQCLTGLRSGGRLRNLLRPYHVALRRYAATAHLTSKGCEMDHLLGPV